jgi:predicted AAA+ superfamily ATPase
MDLFKKYLISGGLPDVVNTYLATKNVVRVRALQSEIQNYYAIDASKYDADNRLKIRKIYEMLPSVLENKKKRIVVKDIESKTGKRYSDYEKEFEYLIQSGIALEVRAISNPVFPLLESNSKNLLKLYLNDVGLLTNVLYKNNIRAIVDDVASVNLGSVYECVVASELKAHGKNLFYYDN